MEVRRLNSPFFCSLIAKAGCVIFLDLWSIGCIDHNVVELQVRPPMSLKKHQNAYCFDDGEGIFGLRLNHQNILEDVLNGDQDVETCTFDYRFSDFRIF